MGIGIEIGNLLEPFRGERFDFSDERTWANFADQELTSKTSEVKIAFWEELVKLFIEREQKSGHLHKGHIFWRLGLELLLKGDLKRSMESFQKSLDEDRIRGDDFTAAQGVTQVLAPLCDHTKVLDLYDSLNSDEKKEFATTIILTHDQLISRQLIQIKDDFFTFVDDRVMRQIVYDTYKEVFLSVSRVRHETFYSSVFAIGSIIEGMIDDLFSKNNYEVWKTFTNDEGIQRDQDAREFLTTLPNDRLMLGQKLEVLRLMSKHGKTPISKVAILQMYVVYSYRNLIHPNKRKKFRFSANWYIAAALFTFISHIAGNWWPQNIKGRLGVLATPHSIE